MAAFVLAVFISGAAQAEPPLPQIIVDFCESVLLQSSEAGEELNEARNDLQDCPMEFTDCGSGLFNKDVVSCLVDYADCTENARRDADQACSVFSKRLSDAYEDALRQSRRNGVEDRFQRWIQNRGQECLTPAVIVADTCAGIL